MPGVYEVPMGADTAYVSADGRYIFAGDLFEIDSRTNLTETKRSAARSKLIAKIDEREAIVFGPASAQHTITVFTDVECGYCRKLHSEIDQLNKLGVRVRYLAYPRSGPGTEDWRKMEAVWCSADRKAAITSAKQDQEVKARTAARRRSPNSSSLATIWECAGRPPSSPSTATTLAAICRRRELKQQLDELSATARKCPLHDSTSISPEPGVWPR